MKAFKISLVCLFFLSICVTIRPNIYAETSSASSPLSLSKGFYASPYFPDKETKVDSFVELAKTSSVIEIGNVNTSKGSPDNSLGFGSNTTSDFITKLKAEIKKYQERDGKVILKFGYAENSSSPYLDLVDEEVLDEKTKTEYVDKTSDTDKEKYIENLAKKYTEFIDKINPNALALSYTTGVITNSTDRDLAFKIKAKVFAKIKNTDKYKKLPLIIDIYTEKNGNTITPHAKILKEEINASKNKLTVDMIRGNIYTYENGSDDTAKAKNLTDNFDQFKTQITSSSEAGISSSIPLGINFQPAYKHGPSNAWTLTDIIVGKVIEKYKSTIKFYGIDQKSRPTPSELTSNEKLVKTELMKLDPKTLKGGSGSGSNSTGSKFALDDNFLFKDPFYAPIYRADVDKIATFKELAKNQLAIEIGTLNIAPTSSSSKDPVLSFGKQKKNYDDFTELQDEIEKYKNIEGDKGDEDNKIILKFATQKYDGKTYKEPAARRPAIDTSDLVTMYKDAIDFFHADAIAIPIDDSSVEERIELIEELQKTTGYENLPIILDVETQKNFKKTLEKIKDSSMKFSSIRILPLLTTSSSSSKKLPAAIVALLKKYQKIVKDVFDDHEDPWEMIGITFAVDYDHVLTKGTKKKITLADVKDVLENEDLEGVVKAIGTEQQKPYASSSSGEDKKVYDVMKAMNNALVDDIG